MRFSVIIPLYNKRAEIGDTLRSALAQTCRPIEIVVVDDGSTDRSGDVVRAFDSPLIKLVTQPNGGECAARNRAIAESTGDMIALLDADDCWEPQFLERIAALATDFPDCGIYCSAFNIVSPTGRVAGNTPSYRGVVENFFRQSMTKYVVIPSASVIPRRVIDKVGGFPVGMRLGGDQYMWLKIASQYRVCFTPERLVNYSMVASNRSAAIYRPEQTLYSLDEFYDPDGDDDRNEFVARVAIGKALDISAKGGTEFARHTIEKYEYTKLYRRGLRKLKILNSLPSRWRPTVHSLYQRLAWRLAHKGL